MPIPWTVVGLVIVVVAFVSFVAYSYIVSGKFLTLEVFEGPICQLTGRWFCTEKAMAKLSTQDLVSTINYICGEEEKPSSEFISCYDLTGGKRECSVQFTLPQGTINDWIPANGDPQFLVYYEMLDPGETVVWRNAQQIDFWVGVGTAVLFNIPWTKMIAPVQKLGTKIISKSTGWAVKFFSKLRGTTIKVVGETIVESTTKDVNLYRLYGFWVEKTIREIPKETLKNMAKVIKGPVSLAAGRLVGKTAEEAVLEYELSQFNTNLPCEENSLCFKIPYDQFTGGPEIYKLSEKCRGYYIELKKREDADTRFYLASPCYARVEVKFDKCGCNDVYLVEDELTGKSFTICNKTLSAPDTANLQYCLEQFSDPSSYYAFDVNKYDEKCKWKDQSVQQVDCIKITPKATTPKGENNFCYSPIAHYNSMEVIGKGLDIGGIAVPILVGAACAGCTFITAGICSALCAAAAFGAGVSFDVASLWTSDQATWPYGYLEVAQ